MLCVIVVASSALRPACDADALLPWARAQRGAHIHASLAIRELGGGRGRGVVLTRGAAPLPRGEALVRIGSASPLVLRTAEPTPLRADFAQHTRLANHATAAAAAATYHLAWTLALRHRSRKDLHAPYFACLPRRCTALWCWSAAELAALGDSSATQRAASDRAALDAAHLHIVAAGGRGDVSRTAWRWAVSTVVARAFRDPSRGDYALALVPILDMVNHDADAEPIRVSPSRPPAAARELDWTIESHRVLSGEDEVLWAYARGKGLFEMFAAYGFVPTQPAHAFLRVRLHWRAASATRAAAALRATCKEQSGACASPLPGEEGALAVVAQVASPLLERAPATLPTFRAITVMQELEACAPECDGGDGAHAECVALVATAAPLPGACEGRALGALRATVAALLIKAHAPGVMSSKKTEEEEEEEEEVDEEEELDAREARWALARAYRDARRAIVGAVLRDVDVLLERHWSGELENAERRRNASQY